MSGVAMPIMRIGSERRLEHGRALRDDAEQRAG